MSSTPTTSHTPAHLTLPEFDDDDAFDAHDDNFSQIFSPDAIREEMARNMPSSGPSGDTWGDSDSTTGGKFSDHNTSVSTLDIGSYEMPISHSPPPLQSPLASSLSASFSHISLSSPVDEQLQHQFPNPEDDYSPSRNDHKLSHPEAPRTPPTPSSPQRECSLSQSNTPQPPTPSSAPTRITRSFPEAPLPSPPYSSPASTSEAPAVPSVSLPAISAIPARSQTNGYLTEKPPSHRPHRSLGPSAFEKVRSKTRPIFLPPKPREEDDKHMADWQKMMKQSRLAGTPFSKSY